MRFPPRFCFLIIAVLISFSQNLMAQLQVGVRGGVNFANFKPANGFSYQTRVRTNFAVLLNKSLSSKFSIQIEPGFSQLGAKYNLSGEGLLDGRLLGSKDVGKVSINYIELPILFQYKPKLGKFEGILSLGPELRLRAGKGIIHYNSKIYYDRELIKDESGQIIIRPNLRDFDYGIVGGIGIAYPLRTIKLFTEARYHLGLRQIYKGGVDMYNRSPSLHLGIMLPL